MLSNLFRSADLDSQFAGILKQGRRLYFGSYSTANHVVIMYIYFGTGFCNDKNSRILFGNFFYVAANEIPSKALPLVKEQAINNCVSTLYSYRKFCATVTSTGQLILPEALKLLPLYTLGISLALLINLNTQNVHYFRLIAPCAQGTFYDLS